MKTRFQFDDAFLVHAKPIKRIQKKHQGWTWLETTKASLGMVLLVGISFFLFFQNTKPLSQTGYDFVFSTQNNDWNKAYSLLSSQLQERYSTNVFENRLSSTVLIQSNAQTYFHTVKPGHNQAILQGTVYTENQQTPLQISIQNTHNGWKITDILIGTDPFGVSSPTPILRFGAQ